jgi:hypothetical protein
VALHSSSERFRANFFIAAGEEGRLKPAATFAGVSGLDGVNSPQYSFDVHLIQQQQLQVGIYLPGKKGKIGGCCGVLLIKTSR